MRRIRRRRKSDACLEAMEKVSVVRHFLSASELRWDGKPRFSHPQTVALATTMCRNSDELAVGNSAKFSSDPMPLTDWVSNIVLVNKKKGNIQVFIDYHDINRACPKDNYRTPLIDQIID